MDQDQQHYWSAAYSPFCPSVSSDYLNSSQGPGLAQYSFYPPTVPVPVDLTQQELGCDKEEQVKDRYSYDVKIINPNKKSDFVVRRWHDVTEVFQTTALLKVKLHESFPRDISTSADFKLGYIQGNTRCWIFEERDLKAMYESFKPDSKITLWCDGVSSADHLYTVPKSKRRKTSKPPVLTPTSNLPEAVDDVDKIFKDLKEKHPDMECPKLRLWAKFIYKGRCDDYDNPPDIPLITGSPARAKKTSLSNALVDAATVVAKAFQASHTSPSSPTKCVSAKENTEPPKLSPMKYAQLRRSCLEDLKALKDLYQDDVLSQAEFTEEKSRILSTLKTIQ